MSRHPYQDFVSEMQKIADLSHTVGLLHWDTEIYMPSGGSTFRSRQIATLSGITHELFTRPELGQLLNNLIADTSLGPEQRRNVELTLKDYEREIKLDKSLVEELAAAKSQAFNRWVAARKASDFAVFQPALEALIVLKRKEAHIRADRGTPYDALLDLYEPGLESSRLDKLFDEAKTAILPLLDQIGLPGENGEFLQRNYPRDQQWDFGLEVLKAMGYDLDHGRQDISPHPFTISFSPEDVRVTTRIDENDFLNMTWSCIHEGGHALYEQGLPTEHYGLPLGSSASLGIHESQSRLWENHVGRGLPFWEHWYPILRERFPDNLRDITLEQFHRAINRIAPNYIRTEADELHYHLHVIIRYEIERDAINSDLPVEQMRTMWNEKYGAYLGLDAPDDANGILQDVHWSHGSFGYFPTYSIGSFYAAQFFHAAEQAIPGLSDQIRAGKTDQLLQWLRKEIHAHGRMFDPEDLCVRVTGKPLDVTYFVQYMRHKLEQLGTLTMPTIH